MQVNKGISTNIPIDEIDIKILKILIMNARQNQKDIAMECEISSGAVLRRIKKLKASGVIVGTRILFDENVIGNPHSATVLIDVTNSFENSAKEAIRQLENVVICAESIGRYNLCSLIIVQNLSELNQTVGNIKNIRGVNSVSVNIWTGKRYIDFARDLKATGS